MAIALLSKPAGIAHALEVDALAVSAVLLAHDILAVLARVRGATLALELVGLLVLDALAVATAGHSAHARRLGAVDASPGLLTLARAVGIAHAVGGLRRAVL